MLISRGSPYSPVRTVQHVADEHGDGGRLQRLEQHRGDGEAVGGQELQLLAGRRDGRITTPCQ